MQTGVVRSLVFACSLLLALPPGWCCWFCLPSAAAAPRADAKSAPAHAGGCCPCCPSTNESQPDPTGKVPPTEKPSAPADNPCSCSERDVALPAPTPAPQADPGCVAILVPAAAELCASALLEVRSGSTWHPPNLRLHVSNCVWLC